MSSRNPKIARVLAAVGAGLLGIVVVGTATGRADTAQDVEFLALLGARGFYYSPDGGTSGLLHDAHLVCGALDAGETPASVRKEILSLSSTLRSSDAEIFMAAAVAVYCPRYLGDLA
jgi:hypothetical protein